MRFSDGAGGKALYAVHIMQYILLRHSVSVELHIFKMKANLDNTLAFHN